MKKDYVQRAVMNAELAERARTGEAQELEQFFAAHNYEECKKIADSFWGLLAKVGRGERV